MATALTTEPLDYYVVTTYDSCTYRNGLTCGAKRERHPLVQGPEGAHEFQFSERIQRVDEREFGLLRQLAEARNEQHKTFLMVPKGTRPWDSSAPEGRLDANGERWWACDGYPTWYRWDETADGPKLRGKNPSVAWA